MKITLRNPVDGSTVEADSADTDRIERLAVFGYRPVGEIVTLPKGSVVVPAKKKRAARKKG